MTREQLIKVIFESDENWSCPDAGRCEKIENSNPNDYCMYCAERLLAEYEADLKADLYDEVRDEVEQRLNCVLEDEKRLSKAEGIDEFVAKVKELYPNDSNALYKLQCIAEQLKEQK